MYHPRGSDYRTRLYESYFQDHMSQLRSPSIDGFRRAALVWRKRLKGLLPADRSSRILEIGCGYGELLHYLQSSGYQNACGVDISIDQISKARSLGVRNLTVSGVHDFFSADDAPYDAILAFDLVEHFTIEELIALFDLVLRRLKPGGTFIFQTTNADGPFSGRYRHYDLTHQITFTRASITQLLKVSGFADISVMPIEPVVHGVKSLARWGLWKVLRSLMIFYQIVETGSGKGFLFTQNMLVRAERPKA